MNENDKKIINKEVPKMKVLRKSIKKIMNLNDLKNFMKLPNIDSIISLYSSKKSYISPKQGIIQRKKINNKKINPKILPKQHISDLPEKNIKEIINIKENKNERKEIKKYNYKKKININKQKLEQNKDNNLILKCLIDDNEGTFDSNSLEKANNPNKLKNYINNKIIDIEKNKNSKNNIFDMGSISHISKNGSSAKEKNIEEDIKNNNNAFEKIVYDFIEEENCKNLFMDDNDNNENNIENNPTKQQYKSKALKEILNNENNENKIEEIMDDEKIELNEKIDLIEKNEKENNEIIINKFMDGIMEESEKEVNVIKEFADDIMKESKKEVILVEEFVEDIFIEPLSIIFVKSLFDEIIKDFRKQKDEKNIYFNNKNNNIKANNNILNNKEIKDSNNNIDILNYKKMSEEINKSEDEDIYEEKINSGNNSDFLEKEEDKKEKRNILFQSQKIKDVNSIYKRMKTLPGVSNYYRFGFLRKSSIRREYQQRKYNTLNTDDNYN